MASVLLVYGSRYGSTAEIALEIGQTLEKNELKVDICDLKNKNQLFKLENYNGIIIGSGIRMGRWTKETLNFLRKNKEYLKNIPLGVFITSGEAANPKTYTKAKDKYLKSILQKNGINGSNIIYEAFGGVFDLSSSSNYNFIEKKILKKIAQSDQTGFIVTDGKLNDFRNWKSIKNWATDFGNLVKINS